MKKPKKDIRGLKEIRDYIRGMEMACDNEDTNPEQYKRFVRYGSILDDLIMELEMEE